MATLTVQQIALDGTGPTFAAADVAGDEFAAGPRTYLEVVNDGIAACEVTVDDPNSVSPPGANAFDPDVVVSVPASESRKIGPFQRARFGDTDQLAQVTYDQVTSVTVGVFSIGDG